MTELKDTGTSILRNPDLYKQQHVDTTAKLRRTSNHNAEESNVLTSSQSAIAANSELSQEILYLLGELTTEEKVTLLSGVDFVHTAGIPRLNIPGLKLADSTSAVKGANLHNGTPTACFPCTSALASTWDCSLLKEMGISIAAQTRYKAAQVVLGPTVNIHRDPRAGRNFESFSEDPVLTGWMAAALITGIHSQGVGTCTKHFVANESETLRRKCNSKVDERTLREIYLAPFQWIVREGKPNAIMTSYNKLNGAYACETPLVKHVLRKEWGFEGLVMSDWFGTTSRAAALEAGLDLEMPGPTVFRGAGLIKDVDSGCVPMKLLDERVAEVLKFMSSVKQAQSTAEEVPGEDEATSTLCRRIAVESMILLKNENRVLPLNFQVSPKIAIIGKPSIIPSSGGGSAAGTPQYIQRPYDQIKATHPRPELVCLAEGVQVHKTIPIISSSKLLASNGKHGIDVKYWNNGTQSLVLEEFLPVPHMVTMGRLKPGLAESGFRYEITTNLRPTTTGLHTLAVQATGSFELFVDGQEVLTAEEPNINMEDFLFVPISHESRAYVRMSADQSYKIELRANSRKPHTDGEPTPHSAKLCLLEQYSDEDAIQEACALAATSDVAVVFAGRNSEWEGEGSDLESIELMASQVSMIKAVAAASREKQGKVVVILYGGNPFDVSKWVDDVDALVFAHYPGQEGGAALADLLTGVANPSGKLPMSWPKSIEATPTFSNFPGKDHGKGIEIDYQEGLRVGYRHFWEAERQKDIRWPFGFGLSYTNFAFSDLQVLRENRNSAEERLIDVSVTVSNIGNVAGAEVVQVYVEDVESSVWRPKKELKSFSKVYLQPQEKKVVQLTMVEKYALSFWDVERSSWVAERGAFKLHVDKLSAELILEEEFIWTGI